MLEAYIVHHLGKRITAFAFALVFVFTSALIALPFIIHENRSKPHE
jgi:hypothetical protein